jgi:hypothetical protein
MVVLGRQYPRYLIEILVTGKGGESVVLGNAKIKIDASEPLNSSMEDKLS